MSYRTTCADLYRNLSQVPSLANIAVTPDEKQADSIHWEATWSQRDLERGQYTKYRTFGTVHGSDRDIKFSKHPGCVEVSSEKVSRISPCGRVKAVLVETTVKDETKQYLELWRGSLKTSTVDLAEADVHGVVHTKGLFRCMRWSHDATKLLYVAEKKPKKTSSFFKNPKKHGAGDESEPAIGDQFLFKENWGEQLYKCENPTLFVYDTVTKTILDLDCSVPANVSVSTAVWSSDDRLIYFCGFQTSPWRVGLIYCMSRPSGIYAAAVHGTEPAKAVISRGTCVYSPAVTPDGNRLVFLETKAFGPHIQCAKLVSVSISHTDDDLQFGDPQVITDIVTRPETLSDFQGLYLQSFVSRCWLRKGSCLVIESHHRSNVALLSIDIDNGKIVRLADSGEWRLHAVCNDVIFASHSLPNQPQMLMIGRAIADGVKWQEVEQPFETLSDIKWSVVQTKPKLENSKFPDLDFESLLVMPKTESIRGLVASPHGGPHSCWVAGFNLFTAGLCRLGFAVLRVNYRGSIGFGQDSIESLPGRVGSQDVADMQQAAEATAVELGVKQVFVQGGSHGGFLTLHLIGQHPDFYSAAVVRNPVCNVVANTCASDIPDWSYTEAGVPFSYGTMPSSEGYARMLHVSPVRYADKVRTPLLIQLGAVDKRVPYHQSIEYMRILRSSREGAEVKVALYEGNDHPIAEVEAEADCVVNGWLWYLDRLLL